MAKQLNIGNTTSPVDVNITESLKINGKTAVVSSSESLGESTRPLYLENGELLAGSQQYTFWENDTSNNVIVQTAGNYLLKTGDTMTGLLSTQNVNPSADNTYSLGTSTYRYSNVFSTVGTIGTLNATTLNVSGVSNHSNRVYITGASTGANDHTGMLSIVNNFAGSGGCYFSSIACMAPNMGDSQHLIIIGKARNAYNSAYMAYKHVADGSPSNKLTFGLYAVDQKFNIMGNGQVLGACWNDYAEYRKSDCIEPGRCIVENGDDSLSLSTKRLQPGAEIISDTFGFAIGEMEDTQTPIAVSGRVLAYPYENKKDLIIGMPVCSGPNGTVSQMTEEEAREYPWCIIGYVSGIPNYEYWGQNKVFVNNRIWIRVR